MSLLIELIDWSKIINDKLFFRQIHNTTTPDGKPLCPVKVARREQYMEDSLARAAVHVAALVAANCKCYLICLYKLRATLFVRDGLLNYWNEYNKMLHTGSVWSILKDRILNIFFGPALKIVRMTCLNDVFSTPWEGVLSRCAKHERKTVSDFYWLKTPAASPF